MKIVTPRPSTVSYKTSKVNNNNNSPSYGIVTTLRRIESMLLSTAEDASNINDTLNCHIDSTNKQFQDIQDKFTSFSNTVKVQTNSALAAVEEVFTQTQLTSGNRHKQNSWFCKEMREDNFRFWWRRVHEDASQGMYMSKIEIFFFTARILQNQRMLCCGECFHD